MNTIAIPDVIETALRRGAGLAISISGGKDSQAMLRQVTAAYEQRETDPSITWPGQRLAIHANLGRAEWPQSLGHCEALAREEDIRLLVALRSDGADLVDRWWNRMERLRGTGKPFWSDSKNRYCTSDLKRDPINKELRQFNGVIISAEGVRAEESPARAKKPVVEIRKTITATRLRNLTPEQALAERRPGERLALDWRPIHHFKLADVWEACGTSLEELQQRQALYREGQTERAVDGWIGHPAYVFGNERLSCALCVLASKNDLLVGAFHNPEHYEELTAMERESGCSFRSKMSLESLRPVIWLKAA